MKRTRSRRVTALLVGLAMLAGLVGFAPTANAEVGPAGPVTFTLADGEIVIANGGVVPPISLGPCDPVDPECDPSAPPLDLAGAIDSDGNVLVPKENVVFPPMQVDEPLPVDVLITSPEDVTGVIDPAAGTASMHLQLSVVLDVDTFGALCTIALDMPLSGTYNQATGVVSVSNSTFAIPALSCLNPAQNSIIGGMIGLPSPSGNSASMVFELDPVIEAIIPVGPPVVIDTAATVGLGGAATRTITQLANPVQTCALVGPNGGASMAESVLLNGFQVTYVHDAAAGPGTDTVDYECTNSEGTDSGTLTVSVSGLECTAGLPGQSAPGCPLLQFIEFEILGDVLSMSQEEANITLETITLNGAPQVTIGSMNTVTVVNRRGDGQAWDLTGQVTDFKVDGLGADCPANQPALWRYQCIPGDNLGWYPGAEVIHEVVPGDVAAVTAGSVIDPEDIAAGDLAGSGLGSSAQALCSAGETTSGGSFACGAGLALVVPASAAAGQYQATLTLTLS